MNHEQLTILPFNEDNVVTYSKENAKNTTVLHSGQ